MEITATIRCFGGNLYRCKHQSAALGDLPMNFSVYVPEIASPNKPVPHIYFLSGLTCTDENFVTKAGAFKKANELGIALIIPDTSPRGANVPGEKDSWDFGVGAGFYLNATASAWAKHYRMYDYIVKELPEVVGKGFPAIDKGRKAIMGHSMGGHGALTIAFKNPGMYKSVSAFAPICNPVNCPWGKKAFTGYLGPDSSTWGEYDAVELVKTRDIKDMHILVDQGSQDTFLKEQLLPQALVNACLDKGVPLTYRLHAGYDHSYYFISSFIEDHLTHHSKYL